MIRAQPAAGNRYRADHVAMLRHSYRQLTGRDLVTADLEDIAAARMLWHAPFALLSHDTAADPLLTYANRTALALFDQSWQALIGMPSRLTAEMPLREERARLLQQVTEHGFIDDYSGIRISGSGRRFRIERATVWNLVNADGRVLGQAATFADWHWLDRPQPASR
jgi:hypothetical protein